ncbi:glycoside hydrolase family 6 protein [Actinoplanes sp. NPDC023936]|uniref:glycoside hydrolase family 6 protein n=1 Tax=Actinoplanes sp. NPDC023936 TaxID=3154910 RepID=UPI0033D061D8
MRTLPALCGLAALVALGGCTAGDPDVAPSPTATAESSTAADELAAGEFYVEPDAPPAGQVAAWTAAGRVEEAAAMRRIAESPAAVWFADGAPGYAEKAHALVTAAAASGRVPVLVAYYVPQRDCGGHSGGGAPDAASYRGWIAGLAAAIRDSRAIVVLEPDAVTHVLQGCVNGPDATERYALLAEAVAALKAGPGVRVYLDGGNPSWVRDVDRVAAGLVEAGVRQADGFSLNVANFETTEANVEYGTRISERLGGKRFVIDTSRNGNGPAAIDGRDAEGHWCNPPGRALGPAPTMRTGQPLVDAYLWVKRPGESDGACRAGAPPAGQWWPEYALELATN